MKAAILSPFTPISKNIASHRSAEAIIYADQVSRALGYNVDIHRTGNLFDYHCYDRIYVYHGNDWGGSLNLFGGMKEYSNIDSIVQYSSFKGKIFSIKIDHPDYHGILTDRISLLKSKGKNEDINPRWNHVDWDGLKQVQERSITINPNLINPTTKLVIGDSHSICLYRPGWMVNSNPFKTLFGALKDGLYKFMFNVKIDELELYFGNIDIRHHLCRQPDPEQATRDLVREYFDQAKKFDLNTGIYEPLPIENECRVVPKSGFYKGTAFYGSWNQRNHIRDIFIDECKKQQSEKVRLIEWTKQLMNDKGELDFKYMEKPKSIHLSREFYPHWQGKEMFENNSTLEDLFYD